MKKEFEKKSAPSQGLKWVKASERLPNNAQLVALKFWDGYGAGESNGRYIIDRHYGSLENNEVEWLDESAPSQGLREEDYYGVKIFKNDKVNSILSAALRFLDEEQMIVLRNSLIRRTPLTSTPDGSQRKFKYNPENGYWWDENGTPFLSEELSEIISGSQGLREALEKIRDYKIINHHTSAITMKSIATEALNK